jgi:hypothetical protein
MVRLRGVAAGVGLVFLLRDLLVSVNLRSVSLFRLGGRGLGFLAERFACVSQSEVC